MSDYNYLTEHELDEIFDECIDDCEEKVKICGLEYYPSVVLYRVDPTAYRCARNDYIDSLISGGFLVEVGDKIYHDGDQPVRDEWKENGVSVSDFI